MRWLRAHGLGLIPARAGTTNYHPNRFCKRRAHPRSRGDHPACAAAFALWGGSSPLARGPLLATEQRIGGDGLIPARAGTTDRKMTSLSIAGAHPRSRGDHDGATACALAASGSSPLARGPPVWNGIKGAIDGLIPARAGTTKIIAEITTQTGAHPRSRGDHGRAAPGFCASEGSSPLARGPPTGGIEQLNRVGLIPARAGTTLAQCEKQCHRRAHPRSRGDHNVCASTLKRQRGSSPLARGPLASTVDIEARAGLIPARAGTTVSLAVCSVARRAHPRSRGDHSAHSSSALLNAGSSPLARGPPQATLRMKKPSGLIPARAGTTRRRS